MRQSAEAEEKSGIRPPGVVRDRLAVGVAILRTIELALAENRLSRASMARLLQNLVGGALYAWVFHYMPIGRAFTLCLLPTPEQRLYMYKKAWQLVYERHYFLADFWNSGTASFGCISAGHGGGYLTIDWNGAISPCVFVPYSPVNIHDIYAQGKTLTDAWAHPFFARLRSWQDAYSNEKKIFRDDRHGNWLIPCPNRDHHEEFSRILQDYDVKPVDENAAEALADPEYHRGLAEYGRAVASLLDPIWETKSLKWRPR